MEFSEVLEKSSVAAKQPSYRKDSSKSVQRWLEAKRVDDNAEGLWRVHDKLYDLINFIRRHPGGADWLKLTRGTDITELFETHHIRGKAELLLSSFYVREAKMPRNYRITFCDDGFYKTLKKRVNDQLSVLNKSSMKTSNVSGDKNLNETFNSKLFSTFWTRFLSARLSWRFSLQSSTASRLQFSPASHSSYSASRVTTTSTDATIGECSASTSLA